MNLKVNLIIGIIIIIIGNFYFWTAFHNNDMAINFLFIENQINKGVD